MNEQNMNDPDNLEQINELESAIHSLNLVPSIYVNLPD